MKTINQIFIFRELQSNQISHITPEAFAHLPDLAEL